jgi:glycosyltransferase involved in cell wall biosynthesis
MKPQTLEARSATEVETIALEPMTKAEALPFVTVVVPCRNEEKHIGRCLESILANDYPKERMEILVVDGISEDRTREIVAGYSKRYPMIRLVENPDKHIPAAMNLGIKNAQGETIIKMDAHSTFRREHISLCVAYQEKYAAENVGGVCKMTPGADTATARAIVLGLGSRFGSGNANVKVGVEKPTWSDSTAFGCFKKDLFERIGMYDEHLLSSSDLDLNQRIQAAGGRILVVPDVIINYLADANLRALRRHVFADGVWVSYVMKFGKKAWSWRHWVPAAFVLSLVAAFALGAVNRGFLWLGLVIAVMYTAASVAVSLQIAVREREPRYAFLLPIVFAVRHFVHGIGTLFGILLVIVPGEHWKGRRGLKA